MDTSMIISGYNRKSNFSVVYMTIFILLQYFSQTALPYVLPEPTFEVLQPRGIRVSIPDEPDVRLFAFHGNKNKGISLNQQGEISGETFRPRSGKWIIEDTEIHLQNGDVINYWIYVQTGNASFTKEDQTWTVVSKSAVESHTEENKLSSSESTSLNEKLILEENFNFINKSLWTRDLKMPLEPDYEFCVYHNENHEFLLQTKDGILRIQPLLLEDYYGENATTYGLLRLNGCTSIVPEECTRRGMAYSILPPIISGRLTTKHSFSFRYGKIEIRAKFPEGDWIYPEMWLEPKYQTYGPGYESGRILLGLARGNENLLNRSTRAFFDSRKLDFGLRVGTFPNISEHIISKTEESGPRWTQDFHVYTTIWDSNGFQFLVDGQSVGRLTPGFDSWLQNDAYTDERKSAPFDQEFYITIGVGVGGIRVFPDGTTSGRYLKPWRNVEAKAMLKFWHAKSKWLPSWRETAESKHTAFQIDYIRVWKFE